MKKRESNFTSAFRRWAMFQPSAAWEVKHTRGRPSFLMRELKQHQVDALRAVKGPYGFAYKIPDDGIAYKPFDMFSLRGEPAWVVIAYPEAFCVIDVDAMAVLKDAKRSSLSFKEAKAIATQVVVYKEI